MSSDIGSIFVSGLVIVALVVALAAVVWVIIDDIKDERQERQREERSMTAPFWIDFQPKDRDHDALEIDDKNGSDIIRIRADQWSKNHAQVQQTMIEIDKDQFIRDLDLLANYLGYYFVKIR